MLRRFQDEREPVTTMIWQGVGKALFEGHIFTLPMISEASVLGVPGSRSVIGTNQKAMK